MKKTRRLLAVCSVLALVLITMSVCVLPTVAETNEELLTYGDFTYVVTSYNWAILQEYTGDGNNVEIPESIDGCPVEFKEGFDFSAFDKEENWQNGMMYCGEWLLTASGGTKRDFLGRGAVREKVYIKEGTRFIAQNAFCGIFTIKSVVFPDSVERIGSHAFSQCNHLEEVSFPEKMEYIGFGAFSLCDCLKNVVLPSGIKEVSSSLFEGSGLKEVVIPETVEEIADRAFLYCSLEKMIIGSNVVEIGREAFGECPLEYVYIPISVVKIGSRAFYNDKNVKTIYYYEGSEEQWFTKVDSSMPAATYYNWKVSDIPGVEDPTTKPSASSGEENEMAGDVNGDNAVNMKDVLILRKYLAELIDTLEV